MRVKTGTVRHKRHKKILKAAKGFKMANRIRYSNAKQAVLHAGQYAYHGRKLRKRDFRRLWIQRINAALTPFEIKYSEFIHKMIGKKITLNRKMLAELAINNPKVFEAVVNKVK
jgi:large subunit ribosomal protein L20